MADDNGYKSEQYVRQSSDPSSPGPKQPNLNGDHDYIVLSPPETESDSGSAVSLSSIDKSKSQGSSVSSFADVIIPGMDATLEKGPTEEEVRELVEDAKKDLLCNSREEVFSDSGRIDSQDGGCTPLYHGDKVGIDSIDAHATSANEQDSISSALLIDDHLPNESEKGNQESEMTKDRTLSDSAVRATEPSNVAQFSPGNKIRVRASTLPGQTDEGNDDDDAVLFSGITYLGSSTVNAPVSEIELKRTMSILREQTEVTIDVLLSVGSTSDSIIRLMDPETQTDIATYRIQRILFCGRGDADGSEKDCFAFNTVHGDSEIFHCHVFRCEDPEKVSFS